MSPRPLYAIPVIKPARFAFRVVHLWQKPACGAGSGARPWSLA